MKYSFSMRSFNHFFIVVIMFVNIFLQAMEIILYLSCVQFKIYEYEKDFCFECFGFFNVVFRL